MSQQDLRARLQPKNFTPEAINAVLGPPNSQNILFPLHSTRGVIFPYTPTITTGNVADYDQSIFIHSNYSYNAYIRSYPKAISLTGEFTAQSNSEALYLLSVLHFFRSVTKMYFGITPYDRAGTPPPVLIFNYLGEYQFNRVPVLVRSFDYTLPADIDYVPVNTSGLLNYDPSIRVSRASVSNNGYSYVPTHLSVQIELETQYIPLETRNNFNLDEFRRGALVGKGYL